MDMRTFKLQIPVEKVEEFNRGKAVSVKVPAHWGLEPEDLLEYKKGDNITAIVYGVAKVVSVGEPAAADNSGEDHGRCSFNDVVDCIFTKMK